MMNDKWPEENPFIFLFFSVSPRLRGAKVLSATLENLYTTNQRTRSGRESTELAGTRLGAMEGDSGHPAYVHADRWQNPPRADSDAKSLVERAVVPHSARTYYFGHAAADRRAARYRVRFHCPRAGLSIRFRPNRTTQAPPAIGRRLFRRIPGHPR